MARDVFALLKSANRLPSPPGVALRVLELGRSPKTSLTDVSEVISSDPALAASILKFINSPLAGVGREVSSATRAARGRDGASALDKDGSLRAGARA